MSNLLLQKRPWGKKYFHILGFKETSILEPENNNLGIPQYPHEAEQQCHVGESGTEVIHFH